MARRPTQIGHAGAPLRLVPLPPDPNAEPTTSAGGDAEAEDDRTTVEQPPEEPVAPTPAPAAARGRDPQTATANTHGKAIDEHWDDGTTMDEATMAGSPPSEGFGTVDQPEEMTVEEGRPSIAKLVVVAGNDTGREFVLSPGKSMSIGRAMENDIVLTDIAVSRKHLDVAFELGHWVLKDRGSGNGTLINDRLEDGQCRLQNVDRIEIGHTVFRFEHAGTANVLPPLGWGTQNEDEASTVTGRQPPRPTVKGPPPASAPTARGKPATTPPPPPGARGTIPPRSRPSSGNGNAQVGAVSQRLALPANPTAPVASVDEPAILIAGQALVAASTPDRLDRSMTATAHVEPLSYASGSVPPVQAYPYPTPHLPRGKRMALALAIAAGITAVGVIAMLTTGNDAADDGAGTAAAKTAVASKDVAADVKQGADPAPAPDPTPDPAPPPADDTADDPPPPAPEPAHDPAPPPPAPEEHAVVAPEQPEPAHDTPPTPPVEKATPPPTPKVEKTTPPKVEKTSPTTVAKVEKKPPPKVEKVVKPDKPADKTKATSLASVKKKAASLYASKDFKGAAQACRDAAENASDDDAAALSKLAALYDKLGENLNAGNAAAGTKPTDALAAYRRALAADKELGGTYASTIRDKLGQVAPKAAAGYMAKGNYEAAKSAADAAVDYGTGSSSTITQVRQSLERKAGEFYASGMKLMSSKPEDGKSLLRRVLKIVPLDSPWYTKAYKALNTRPQKRDDDE